MKKIFALFSLLLLSASLYAEYSGYHIQFTLENVNGKVSKGYCYIAASYLDLDSLGNSEYLKKTLSYQIKQDADSFHYYKARLTYEYQNLYDSSVGKSKIYALIDKNIVPIVSIKTIKIYDMIECAYSAAIVNEMKLTDTTWIKRPPVEIFSMMGYSCSYEIIVHEKSQKIEMLKEQLKAKQQEYEARLNEEYELTDSEYEWLIKYDSEIVAILKQLNGSMVVIIALL